MSDLFAHTLPVLFTALLRMSAVAALCALAVMLLRAVLKKLGAPRGIVFLLWAVVLFRMVCPFSFESPAAVLSSEPLGLGWTDGVPAAPPAPAFTAPAAPYGTAAVPEAPPAPSLPAVSPQPEGAGFSAAGVLSILWAAGLLALCCWTGLSYFRLKRRVEAAVRTADGVWETDRIDSPFVLGFFPPKIYLPPGLGGDTRSYVLLHERSHIRRGDHVVKAAAFLALAVHWFNPVLWLAWALACRDMEAACDESVLRQSGADIRRGYSAALLALASSRPVRTPLAFGENGVKGRIQGVLRWRRSLPLAAAAFALLALALGFVLAADPVALPEAPPSLTVSIPGRADFQCEAYPTHWGGGDGGPFPVTQMRPLISAEVGDAVHLTFWSDLPDEIVIENYLLDASASPPVQRIQDTAPDGSFYLPAHSASTGIGSEERTIVVRCRWNSGLRYRECEYGFRMLVPSVQSGDYPAPIAQAGNRPLYLIESEDAPSVSGDQAVTVTPGVVLAVSFSSDVSVDCRVQLFRRETLEPLGGEIGSASARSFQLPDGADGAVLLNILCTYEDGRTGSWWSLLEVLADVPPEVDQEVSFDAGRLPALRYPGDADWTPLLPLLPAPAGWAGDETAARDSAVTLEGIDGGLAVQAGFTTSREGWAVVSIGTGVGWADIYFYRSHDGGYTWTEYGRPEAAKWYAKLAGFSDPDHGVICVDLFNGAPIFTTADGGRTWKALDVSRIYADVGGSGVPDDSVYLADSLLLQGDWGFITLECRSGSWPPICLYTTDRFKTFAAIDRFCLPAGDEAGYRIVSLTGDDASMDLTLALLDGDGGESGRTVLRYDGYAWCRDQPIPDPASLSVDDLPAPTYMDYGGEHRLSTPPSAVYNDPIRVLADLPGADITLYGLNERISGSRGVLLRRGRSLDYYPGIAYHEGPQNIQAEMALGDYDGDGSDELAVAVCTGVGTGVSVHELHIFELQSGGFSRPASLTEEDLRSLVTDYVDSESLVEDGRTLMTLYWSGTKQVCDLTALSEDGKLWEHAAPADQYHFDLTGVPIRASTVLSVRGSVGFIADYSADAVYDGASISLDWHTGRVEVYDEYQLAE